MSQPTPAKSPRLAILYGGEEITVRKMDGTEVTVKVAIVPIRHLPTFIDLYDKPAELVDFVIHVDGNPVTEGWADCLTDLALEEIRTKAKALNFQRAVTWTEQQITAGKEMAIPIVEKLKALRRSVLTQLASSDAPASESSTKASPGSGL